MPTTCERKENRIRASPFRGRNSNLRKIIRTQEWMTLIAEKARNKEKITKEDLAQLLIHTPSPECKQRDVEILYILTRTIMENRIVIETPDYDNHSKERYYLIINTPEMEIKFGFPQDPYLEKSLIAEEATRLTKIRNLWKFKDEKLNVDIVPIIIHCRKGEEIKIGVLFIRDGELKSKYIDLDGLFIILQEAQKQLEKSGK